MAKYFLANAESGVTKIQYNVSNPREMALSSGQTILDCSNASVAYTYSDSSHVSLNGHLRIIFSQSQKIDSFEFYSFNFDDLIPRNRGFIRHSPINEYGVNPKVMRFLEIAEVVFSMSDLMIFGLENGLGPHESLAKIKIPKEYNTSNIIGQPLNPESINRLTKQQGLFIQ